MSAVTEADAREKWCPFSRTTMYVRGDAEDLEKPIDLVGHAANRMVTDDPKLTEGIQACIDASAATRCIGSKCMAWRWAPPPSLPSVTIEGANLAVVELIREGKFINAIKEYRGLTGATLKDSKDYVERLRNALGVSAEVQERRGYCGLAGSITP